MTPFPEEVPSGIDSAEGAVPLRKGEGDFFIFSDFKPRVKTVNYYPIKIERYELDWHDNPAFFKIKIDFSN